MTIFALERNRPLVWVWLDVWYSIAARAFWFHGNARSNDATLGILASGGGGIAFASEADVLDVDVSCKNGRLCSFDVTARHDDERWKHYANRGDVLGPDGEVLAIRVLAHPHDNEQPFTRSLSNVRIPDGVSEVVVRAHDSVHEYGGKELVVQLLN